MDYFVVNADGATSADAAAAFHEVYPGEPRELDIIFPSDNPDDWAAQWLRMYSRTWGQLCRGDGLTATAKIDRETGTWATHESKDVETREISGCGPTCPNYTSRPPRCRPVMNLQFCLPDVRGLGVWQIDTSSFHSMRNVNSQVLLVKSALGGIAGVPLKLRIVPLTVQPPGQKEKTVHVLDLQTPLALSKLQRTSLALPSPNIELPPADDEEPDDLVDEDAEEAAHPVPSNRPPRLRERLAEDVDAPGDGPPAPSNGQPPPMRTRGDLFNACLKRWGDTSHDVARVAGVARPEDIAENHLEDVYQQVAYQHDLKGDKGLDSG